MAQHDDQGAPSPAGEEAPRKRRRRRRRRRGASAGEAPGDPGGGDRLRHLGWLNLLEAFLGHLNMPVARARVQAEFDALESGAGLPERAVLDPRAPAKVIRARFVELRALERTLAAAAGHPDAEGLRGALSGLEDMRPSLEAAKKGETLDLLELLGCADLLAADRRLASALTIAQNRSVDDADLQAFAKRYAPATDLSELGERLERAIDRDGEEGPQLSDRASPALAEARRKLKGAKGRITRLAEKLLRRPDVAESLQDNFWTEREGRVVLPAKSGGLGPFKRGGAIIHGSSASGQTIFVEPRELVELNNELREAQSRFRSERTRILAELSRTLAQEADALAKRQWALVEIAFIEARLRLSQELEGHEPKWMSLDDEDARVWLPAARHANMLLDGVDVVPNDLELRVGQGLIISGPNAGGKTVALKTLGLCLLMARAGLRIPTARGACLPLYTRIVTDVGDDQSIQADLSTFSAQIVHIREALAAAKQVGKGCLVLLDEIAVGTDPEQGAALAESVLQEIVRRGASVVVTTHYERLKLLARAAEGETTDFVNAAVGFDLEALRPTFTLTMGVPGSSSALAVARRLGLDTGVIDRAENLLDDAALRVDVLLQAIAQERVSLEQTRKALEHDREIVQRRSAKLKKKQQSAEAGARTKKQRAWERAAEQLHGLEKELKARRRNIRRAGGNLDELPTRHEATSDARRKLDAERAEPPRPAGAPLRQVEVGMKVGLPAMGQKGEVVAVKGKRVTVQLENLRTTVKVDELRLPPPEASPTKKSKALPLAKPLLDFGSKARTHFGDEPKAVKSGVDNSIDLVGERADVACERMEDFLADALGRDQDVVVLRHGHGSGILRKALRERLHGLPHVRRYRGGISAEGGDAVTVVWLDT